MNDRILTRTTHEEPGLAALLEGFDDAVDRGHFYPKSVRSEARHDYRSGFALGVDTLDLRGL